MTKATMKTADWLANRTIPRRHILAGGAALLAGCGRKIASPNRALYTAESQPEGYPSTEAIKAMGDYLKEKSSGRLRVKLYPGGQLGSEGSTLEIAMFGGLDMTRTFSAALNNIAPLTKIFSLPFLFQSSAHQRRVIDSDVGETIMRSLEPYNLRGVAIYDTGGRGFYTTSKPIPDPEALKGQKIRVPNSDIFLDTISALGANATPMNYGEVYQGLVQKVIDGAENNWPAYISSRHYEVAPYFSETGHFRTPDMLIMSLDTWNSYSEDDQQLIKEAAQHSMKVMRSLWDASVETAKQTLLDNGGEILSDVNSRAFRDLMGPVYTKNITDDLRLLVEKIEALAET